MASQYEQMWRYRQQYNPKFDVNQGGVRFNLEELIDQYLFQRMAQRSGMNAQMEDMRKFERRKTYQQNDYH